MAREPGAALGDEFGANYFEQALGEPYSWSNPTWTRSFGRIAEFIVGEFAPRTALDAGCAIGFLVGALRDRGVDARGIDISEYALSQVPEQLQPYCTLASVTDELDADYDLITCIEVLEHLPPELAEKAVANLTRHTGRIVFSSTPYDTSEPTHVNVLQPDAWVRLFAERGFHPVPTIEALAVSPQAMVLERDGPDPAERLAGYEAVRCELAHRLAERGDAANALEQQLKEREVALKEREVELKETEAELKETEVAMKAERRRADAALGRTRAVEREAARLGAELDELRATTWWRVGAPVRAAVTLLRTRVPPLAASGAPDGVAPRGLQPRQWALRAGRRLPQGVRHALAARFPTTVERLVATPPRAVPPVEELLAERLPLLRPLSVFPAPGDGRLHLTVLTDSLGRGSMFGGVGTSMILAVMLARRLGASLRVVTRLERPDPSNFGLVLRAHGVEWENNIEFSYSPVDGRGSAFPWRAGEIFLTTSWWSTWSALRSVDPKRVVYLLQEDERLFYPAGDEQIACAEVLADPRIRFAVNTAMLHEYLVGEGFTNIAANGVAFEPAFPESIYFRELARTPGRRRFFFYARPNNPRNLFARGLEAISESIVRGILDPETWEVHFVGSRVPRVTLPNGVEPIVSEQLPWTEYAALLRRVDVGLSLMSSPHPSYPPLDLAACGAVAVTNRFGPKQSLERYSANILCTDIGRDSIVEGIEAAAALAADEDRRRRNYEGQRLSRSWASSLDPLVEELVRGL